MCGILGSINFQFNQSVLNVISHRGPDDYGLETFVVNKNNVTLAQRRLSIIDLSPAGHQPMFSPCGNYAIIFNGEIYNHLELREKLSKLITYKGHSDTETILHYLIKYGIDGVKDFNGIFALAFLNLNTKSISLARDHFGVKPLYYYLKDNKLIFSSELRPIKELIKKTKINTDALASLLRLRYVASPDTLYSEINKVIPGHYLSFNLRKENQLNCEEKNYGSYPAAHIEETNEAKLIELYGIELENAVKRQLLSDVEVGVLLSGGIDSAVVAALAKKHYKGNLKAFTIGFDGNYDEDEISDAALTAELLGLDHHVMKITFTDFLELIKECTRIVEEPLATTSIIPMYYLSELASKHVKVVLTGQGADEPLGGYGRYKSEFYRNQIPSFLHPIIKPIVKVLNVKNEQIVRGANSVNVKNEVLRFLSVYEIFNETDIRRLISAKDSLSKKRIQYMLGLVKSDNKKSVENMMAIDSRLNLSDDLLNYTDKITMNFSIECRVPMLDVKLVDFIESLPVYMKVNRKEGKIIHKKFANSILPSQIINRPKKGFQSPTKKWFKEEVTTLKQILLNEKTLFSQIFNLKEVENILSLHVNGFNKEKQIYLLLSIYYWLEENREILEIY